MIIVALTTTAITAKWTGEGGTVKSLGVEEKSINARRTGKVATIS